MSKLREFLDQRESEIKEQIRHLRAELGEVRIAREALNPDPESEAAEGPTIKEMVRAVLKGQIYGRSSSDILKAIETEFNVRLMRTSLSPQLSRMRRDGEVELHGNAWSLVVDKPDASLTQSPFEGFGDADEDSEVPF